MFAATYPMQRNAPSLANAYRQIGVETGTSGASPHKLIQMLFDGFKDAVAQARGAMRIRSMESKGRAIGHALRILDDGLQAGLNMRTGGPLAADLGALYTYIAMRLTHANVHNDEAVLDECLRLIEPISSAWAAIGAQVNATRQ